MLLKEFILNQHNSFENNSGASRLTSPINNSVYGRNSTNCRKILDFIIRILASSKLVNKKIRTDNQVKHAEMFMLNEIYLKIFLDNNRIKGV